MSENPSFKKPLIFKGYKTEKDRIQQNLKKSRYLHNYEDYSLDNTKMNKSLNDKVLSLSPISKHNLNNNFSFNNSLIKNNSLFQKSFLNSKKENIKENIESYYSITPIRKEGRPLSIKEQQKINYHIKNDIILQPQMKFKARTDLERIYDSLNEKYSRKDEKMIIERQLKNIDIFNSKKPADFIKEKLNFSDTILKEYKDNNTKIFDKKNYIKNKLNNSSKIKYYFSPKNNNYQKPWMRRKNLNEEAENMLKSYHYKLHFKAVEEIAENKIMSRKLKNKYSFLLPNLLKEKKTFKKKKVKFNKKIIEEKNEEDNDYNSFYYKNPFKKIIKYNPELIREISEIAFKKDKELKKGSKLNNKIEYKKKLSLIHNLKEDNEIEIDGKTFSKANQFDLIANKILKLCNVYKNKSLYNNNNLKAGSGKTMITQGMSINKFEKKYGLNK